MEAPLITTNHPDGRSAYRTIDGQLFPYRTWEPSERRSAESAAKSHNRAIAVAADNRKGSICTVRELRDGFRPSDPRPIAQQIRESGANLSPAPNKPSNPFRDLADSRRHSKNWRAEMEAKANEWDRIESEKEAKIARETDPVFIRAVTNAQSNLNLCKLDCMVPQSQLDQRAKLLSGLQDGSVSPADYWETVIRLDEENKPIVAPTEPVKETPVIDTALPPIELE